MRRKRLEEAEVKAGGGRRGMVERLTLVVGVIAGGLVVVTVWVSVSFASKGSQLMVIEKEINEVMSENSEMREQMVKMTSVSSLAERIEEMDFSEPGKIEYLSSELAAGLEIMAKLP